MVNQYNPNGSRPVQWVTVQQPIDDRINNVQLAVVVGCNNPDIVSFWHVEPLPFPLTIFRRHRFE